MFGRLLEVSDPVRVVKQVFGQETDITVSASEAIEMAERACMCGESVLLSHFQNEEEFYVEPSFTDEDEISGLMLTGWAVGAA